MSNASERRFDAIKSVSDRVFRVIPGTAEGEWLTTDREAIATMIREIARLGRTTRWAEAVEGWAQAVEKEESLEWAFFQFSVWACYAAE